MNHSLFTSLRRLIDEAITFDDLSSAYKFAREGEQKALIMECAGEVMYFRAQFAIIEGFFEEALTLLRKALVFNPTDGAAYNDIALCMIELGRIEEVCEFFDQGIAVEPDYATIHHNKGWFLNKIAQHEEALVCFQRALELEPSRAVTYENMADAYELLGCMPEAIAAYKQAISCLKGEFAPIREQLEQEVLRLEYA